jgi:hypothetical protein
LAVGAGVDVFLAAHIGGICHHRRRGGRRPGRQEMAAANVDPGKTWDGRFVAKAAETIK